MNNCSCVYVSDDNSPEFFTEKSVIARKQHKCCECGRTIEPGEKYEYACGIWNGDFDTFKMCEDCLSVRDNFFCDGFNYTEIYEALREHIFAIDGKVASSCFEGLTARARDKVFDLIEERWSYLDERGDDE